MALTLDKKIEDVEDALHELYMGDKATRVRIEGEETEFNRTSIPQLEGYLSRLKAQRSREAPRGAIGFRF